MKLLTREESIKVLSEEFPPEQLRKVITQGYSDISLSVMAELRKDISQMLLDSRYSPVLINKLSDAYARELINGEQLLSIADHSRFTTRNAPYMDQFLNSINRDVYASTAVKIFNAMNYENCTYTEAVSYVQSGAFYATDHSSLSVTDEVAEQLCELNVPLRACEGFNYCYDVDDLKETLNNGAAIFVTNKSLAVKVNSMMKQPDWEDFLKYADKSRYTIDTAEELREVYKEFCVSKNADKLLDKLKGEMETFIADLQKKKAADVIGSAYEIVSKSNIIEYCENVIPDLSDEQYSALMLRKGLLHEIYEEWLNNSEWNGIENIGAAIEETADKIKISIDREKEQPAPVEEKPAVPKNTVRR